MKKAVSQNMKARIHWKVMQYPEHDNIKLIGHVNVSKCNEDMTSSREVIKTNIPIYFYIGK